MSIEIKIPTVGESVTSGVIAEWHKDDGATVMEGDLLLTLDTDKVSTEIHAEAAGTLQRTAAEGDEVEIGAVVGKIVAGAEEKAPPVAEQPAEKTEGTPPSDAHEKAILEGKTASIDIRKEVKIPSVGESITSGTIAEWHKKNAAIVASGEVLLTLETDKVSTEIVAEDSGVLTVMAEEGAEVEIGTVVGYISSKPTLETQWVALRDASAKTTTTSVEPMGSTPEQKKKQKASAESESVEEENSPALSVVPPEKKETGAGASSSEEVSGRTTRQKMSPLRKKIATHLVNAQQTAAILTTFNEADMTAVMKLRKEVQENFVAKHGVKLGFMSFFVKAVVEALKEVPQVNARIDGDELVLNHYFDIGVAVGTEKGLIVPVLRDCDQKSFAEIEKDIIGYATRAREGKIQISDLQGGVFTLSNGGVYGSLLSTPILNPPQSGILGMHTIQKRPVAVGDKVEIRPMMYLALSYDHRVVDGKEAVTFLIRIKDCLENPARLLVGA